jgi:outer membrane protein TolC
LPQYLHLSLRDSSETKSYIDTLTVSKYDKQSAYNKFSYSLRPNSSAGVDQDKGSVTLGLIGAKPNIYGGEIYSSITSTKTDSDIYDSDYATTTSIGYKQALFKRWGEKYNSISIDNAKENFELIKQKQRYVDAQIILKACENYYNVVLNHKRIKIYEESLQMAKKDYEIAKAKYDAGMVSAVDMHRAKLTLLNAQKNQSDAKKNFQDQLDEMLYFINQDIDSKIAKNIDTNIDKYKLNFEIKTDEQTLQKDISYKEKIKEEKSLLKEIFKAKRDFQPDITVDMKYQFIGEDETFSKSIDQTNEQWSIYLSSEYNFNNDDKKIAYNKIMIQKATLQRDISNLKRNIIKNIQNVKNQYQNLELKLEIASLRVNESELSLKAAHLRYEQGLGTNLDIMEASKELESAKIEYISNLLSYNLTILQLAQTQDLLDYEFALEMIGE